ncbi:hypothetical protein PAPYR_4960 [Paratrimastix pyriformis]|uniref:Uncharacterized protein n=1 Tax=Paratrimastix pyriformis TaxID=342808 RepID=A0ABQ8UK30_9EUKA|nr:hypothetical protein PAPYR_4960 [Paratrimastix pyriformis]
MPLPPSLKAGPGDQKKDADDVVKTETEEDATDVQALNQPQQSCVSRGGVTSARTYQHVTQCQVQVEAVDHQPSGKNDETTNSTSYSSSFELQAFELVKTRSSPPTPAPPSLDSMDGSLGLSISETPRLDLIKPTTKSCHFPTYTFKNYPYRQFLLFFCRVYGHVFVLTAIACVVLIGVSYIPVSTGSYPNYLNGAAYSYLNVLSTVMIGVVSVLVDQLMVFGWKKQRLVFILGGLICTVICALFYVGLDALGIQWWFYRAQYALYLIPVTLVSLGTLSNVRQYKKVLWWMVPHYISSGIFLLYALVFFKIFPRLPEDYLRSIFRLTVHPLVNEIGMLICKTFGKMLPQAVISPGCIFGIALVFQSNINLFGRHLIGSVGSLSNSVMVTVLLMLYEIFMRLTYKIRERSGGPPPAPSAPLRWALRAGFRPPAILQRRRFMWRISGPLPETEYTRMMRANLVTSEMIFECVGITVSSVLSYFMWPHRLIYDLMWQSPPALLPLVYSFLLQFGCEIVADFVSTFFEIKNGLPLLQAWEKRCEGFGHRKGYFAIMLTVTISSLFWLYKLVETVPTTGCPTLDPCSCAFRLHTEYCP